jgi:asparaginyl-tRNA synthetase
VTHYPKAIKPFYMKSSPDSEEGQDTVLAFDLLLPEVCEVVGGSQRVDTLEELNKALENHQISGNYDWYADLRRYGSFPHAGFGLGFDRFLLYITGHQNIRDVVPFPRAAGSLPL